MNAQIKMLITIFRNVLTIGKPYISNVIHMLLMHRCCISSTDIDSNNETNLMFVCFDALVKTKFSRAWAISCLTLVEPVLNSR